MVIKNCLPDDLADLYLLAFIRCSCHSKTSCANADKLRLVLPEWLRASFSEWFLLTNSNSEETSPFIGRWKKQYEFFCSVF